MGFDDRIDQLKGRSPESCLSWHVLMSVRFISVCVITFPW